MAKIFRTESLNLGGNLLLEAGSAGAFEIKSASGSTLMSRQSIEDDISSLHAQRVADEAANDSDVSSLAALNSAGTGDLESDVSSLAGDISTNKGDLESDVSSLAAVIATNDVVAVSTSVGDGVDNSGSISFGRTFASTPIVVAQLKSSVASDPIIACMVSAVSTSAATVTFADNTPSANYTVELIASIG